MASDTHVCGYLSKTENTTFHFQCLVMGPWGLTHMVFGLGNGSLGR